MSTGEVKCSNTAYTTGNADFKDCQYYPDGQSVLPFRYDTEVLVGHFCLPSSGYTDVDNMKEVFREAFYENVMGNGGAQIFYDIQKCWAVILVATICTFLIAYAYLFLIKLFGGIILWISFGASLLLFIGAGLYSYFPAR